MKKSVKIGEYTYPITVVNEIPKCIKKHHIVFRLQDSDSCDKCASTGYRYKDTSQQYNPIIPISDHEYINISGKRCVRCMTEYSTDAFELYSVSQRSPGWLEITNKTSEEFSAGLCISQKAKDSYPPSTLYVFILVNPEKVESHQIVTDPSEEKPHEKIWHYTSLVGRKLLAAVCRHADKITMDGTEHKFIVYINNMDKSNAARVIDTYDILYVEKAKNGGYYSLDPNHVLIDGLMLCKDHEALGIMSMTLDKTNGRFYADTRQFRSFVKLNGFPDVGDFDSYTLSRSELYREINLCEESRLHAMGYTVNSKDNLSDQARQSILSRAIEGGMLVADILQFLESQINLKGRYPDAVAKYKRDYEFIENYGKKHDCFIFVKDHLQ